MKKYVILNSENKIENIILWNGDFEAWQPPENCRVIEESEFDFSEYEWANNEG